MKVIKYIFALCVTVAAAVVLVACSDDPKVPEGDIKGTDAVFTQFTNVEDDTYSLTVANAVTTFNFNNVVEISNWSTWQLTSDIQGNNVIASRTVSLSEGDNTYYVLVTARNGNVQLYTMDIRRKPMHQVTFSDTNGVTIPNQSIEEGNFAEDPAEELSREGYTFMGWNHDFEDPIMKMTTIAAIWQANLYTITYYANDGTDAKQTQIVSFDSDATAKSATTFTREGFDFIEWNLEPDGNGVSIEPGHVEKYTHGQDVDLYAIWHEHIVMIAPMIGSYNTLKGYSDTELQYNQYLHRWESHRAIVFSAPNTGAVVAVEAGIVIEVSDNSIYGRTIRIAHREGFESYYRSLGLITVSQGDTVEKGQLIGYIGTTNTQEFTDIPHVKFELFKDGIRINPEEYMVIDHRAIVLFDVELIYGQTYEYAIGSIKNMLELLGYDDVIVEKRGKQILVEVPGITASDRVFNILCHPNVSELEFQTENGEAFINRTHIRKVDVYQNPTTFEWGVLVTFTNEGGALFRQAIQNVGLGGIICIYVNGAQFSAVSVQDLNAGANNTTVITLGQNSDGNPATRYDAEAFAESLTFGLGDPLVSLAIAGLGTPQNNIIPEIKWTDAFDYDWKGDADFENAPDFSEYLPSSGQYGGTQILNTESLILPALIGYHPIFFANEMTYHITIYRLDGEDSYKNIYFRSDLDTSMNWTMFQYDNTKPLEIIFDGNSIHYENGTNSGELTQGLGISDDVLGRYVMNVYAMTPPSPQEPGRLSNYYIYSFDVVSIFD